MAYTKRTGMTEEELREHTRALHKKYRDKKRAGAGKAHRTTYATEEERKAAVRSSQRKHYRKKQEATGKAPRKTYATEEERKVAAVAAQRRYYDRYRRKDCPPKPKLTEEERIARQKAYRESYVRPEPTAAQRAKWSESARARSRLRWAEYYANETPEQREARLATKAHYRETEVRPKVREIVEHIKYDFEKATSDAIRQDVADEWADTGLSCWLTAKALWYRDVSSLMERYGYGTWEATE